MHHMLTGSLGDTSKELTPYDDPDISPYDISKSGAIKLGKLSSTSWSNLKNDISIGDSSILTRGIDTGGIPSNGCHQDIQITTILIPLTLLSYDCRLKDLYWSYLSFKLLFNKAMMGDLPIVMELNKLEVKATLGSLLNPESHIPPPKYQFKHWGMSSCHDDHYRVLTMPYGRS